MATQRTFDQQRAAKELDARTRNRVWIPREGVISGAFQTIDGTRYVRDKETGTIHRLDQKVKGKAARKAARAQRRHAKGPTT